MVAKYFSVITIFACFLLTGCIANIGLGSDDLILSPTNDVLAVSPISVSSGGEKMWISESDIKRISERFDIKQDIIKQLGILSGSYDKQAILKILNHDLNTDFEDWYLDFYRTVVRPASQEDLTKMDPKLGTRIFNIVEKSFRGQIELFLSKFKNKEIRKVEFQKGNTSGLFYQLTSVQDLVLDIARVKNHIKSWLATQLENYKFAKSLRITIDMASQNGNPLLTAKRAYATIFDHKSDASVEISLVETGRQCRNQLIACRIVFVHILDDDTRSELLMRIVEDLKSFNEQSPDVIAKNQQSSFGSSEQANNIRVLIDRLTIDLELLVNGREVYLTLPGRFMNITEWDEY